MKKNENGTDPEVNKIVSCRKKVEKKKFHALHKVDMARVTLNRISI